MFLFNSHGDRKQLRKWGLGVREGKRSAGWGCSTLLWIGFRLGVQTLPLICDLGQVTRSFEACFVTVLGELSHPERRRPPQQCEGPQRAGPFLPAPFLPARLIRATCLSWFLVFPLVSVSPPPNGARLALICCSAGPGEHSGSGKGGGYWPHWMGMVTFRGGPSNLPRPLTVWLLLISVTEGCWKAANTWEQRALLG